MATYPYRLRIAPASTLGFDKKTNRWQAHTEWRWEVLDGKGMPLLVSRPSRTEGYARRSAWDYYRRNKRVFRTYRSREGIPLKRTGDG